MKEGILHKVESNYGKEPWTITTVHTNGTIRIQCRTRTERLNIWRVMPVTEDVVLLSRENIYVRMVNSISLFLLLAKNLALFYSNTILTSFMTTQIIMVICFPYYVFFCMIFTSNRFICGG
jgi:hypothetical protein